MTELVSTSAELLTVKQAAKITNYSEEHIRRLIRSGRVEATKPGRKYFLTRAALNDYIKNGELSEEEQIRALAREVASKAPRLSDEAKAHLAMLLTGGGAKC